MQGKTAEETECGQNVLFKPPRPPETSAAQYPIEEMITSKTNVNVFEKLRLEKGKSSIAILHANNG